MAHLPPGNTLQPTALVHEAYLRLIGREDPGWDNRGHFFAAASQAMRQIVVDRARRKSAAKRGGREVPVDIDDVVVAVPLPDDDVLALDEALTALEREEPRRAEIVKLRYFAGFSRQEIAATLGVSTRTIDREWRYIMARLHQEIRARAGDVGPRNNTE
jgi:RNA polymerase sigma factor (TIGR02999 family)